MTNPVTNQINISCAAGIQSIELFSPGGEKLINQEFNIPVKQFAADAAKLEAGIYLPKINGHTRLLLKR